MFARADRCRSASPSRGRAIVVCLCLTLCSLTGRAEDDGIYHSQKTTFKIPFQIDRGDRRVAQVILHVSDDLGKTWNQVTTAAPTDKGFNFTARRDGWYYFTVQTMDQEGRRYPAVLDGIDPGLKVFVDTMKPEVKLRPMTGLRKGELGVEWNLSDEALDLTSLRLEVHLPGQLWQEKQDIIREKNGQLRWNADGPGVLEVRVKVKDKAGNVGEATTTVRSDEKPMNRADEPPIGGGTGKPQITKINSKKLSLNYKIEDVGPSKVSLVEIWMTGSDARTWKKKSSTPDSQPPFLIDIEGGEGLYGITLIAKSGVGLGDPPPRSGDQPQVWVEVDMTKPVVQIEDVIVGRGLEKDTVTIRWNARDKNLKHQPITIHHAPKSDGPWTPIAEATSLENSGKFIWRVPETVPYLFYLRIEAVDEAGNVGSADTLEGVKFDLSMPKVRVLGVEPIKQP